MAMLYEGAQKTLRAHEGACVSAAGSVARNDVKGRSFWRERETTALAVVVGDYVWPRSHH
jgi:hypothetical protein